MTKLRVWERKIGDECYYDDTGDIATAEKKKTKDDKKYDDDYKAPIAIVDCRDDANSYTAHEEESRDDQLSSELNIDIIGVPSLRADSSSLSSGDEETSPRSSSGHNKSDGRHESSCWLIRIPPLFVILTILLFGSLAFVVGTICRIVVLRDSMVHMVNNKIMADDNIMGVVHHPVVHDHSIGQHLLLDIKHIDSSFLNSEERLVSAMVELVASAADNTLLSYHCHQQLSMGVSCAGKICMYSISFILMIPTLTNHQITQTLLYSTWNDTGVLLEGHVS